MINVGEKKNHLQGVNYEKLYPVQRRKNLQSCKDGKSLFPVEK